MAKELDSKSKRAAQFIPFAALRGYYDMVSEVERIPGDKHEATEEEILEISGVLRELKKGDIVKLTYYDTDSRNGTARNGNDIPEHQLPIKPCSTCSSKCDKDEATLQIIFRVGTVWVKTGYGHFAKALVQKFCPAFRTNSYRAPIIPCVAGIVELRFAFRALRLNVTHVDLK